MDLVLVGLNHASAPLDIREAFHVGKARVEALLGRCRERCGASEALLLETCNRAELYASDTHADALLRCFADFVGIDVESVRPHAYLRSGPCVAEHLFEVASGLDSVVLGEDQILGQVAESLALAQSFKASGRFLNSLFQMAVSCGKRVRSETSLGEGSFSVGRVAVDLARQHFGSLANINVLLVGAGKISEISARHLWAQGVRTLRVANRTFQHAQLLAEKVGGTAVPFEDMAQHLADCDLLVSCTGAPHTVIHRDLVERIMVGRAGRGLLLVDLAVPRDIESDAGNVADVRLVNVDHLKSIKEESYRKRVAQIPHAKTIVAEFCERWRIQRAGLQASGLISALHQKWETIRRAELDKASFILSQLTQEQREGVELLTLSLMKKFLHTPTVQLKELHCREREVLPVIRDLFCLSHEVSS